MNQVALKTLPSDDQALDQILQDSLFLEERRSQGYIELMTQIQRTLDQVIPKKVHFDLRDITSRRGSLIYFTIDGIEKEIPYDILYTPKLKHSIRNLLIHDLENHKSRLSLTHRRLLSRLQRIHRLDSVGDSGVYDISQKTKMTLMEIERIMAVASRAHGARKMDVLMEALLIPGRTYFDLLLTLQSFRDEHHPRHKEAIEWINQSRYFGKIDAFEAVVHNAFRQLSDAVARVYDQVEHLTGLKFSRNLENVEAESGWFGLGPVEAVVEEEDGVRGELLNRLRHSRFQEMKREWSQAYFKDREHKILEWAGDDPQRRAQALVRLLFEVQKKLTEAPNPRGAINMAIENDFNLGLITQLEYDDAKAWVLENWKAQANYSHELVMGLEHLKQACPDIILPEVLENDMARVDAVNSWNTKLLQKELAQRFLEIDVEGLEDLIGDLDVDGEVKAVTMRRLFVLLDRIEESLSRVSPGNVPFLRQLRLAYDEQSVFEARVEDLYHRQDEMERLKKELETLISKAWRTLDKWSSLEDHELDRCLEVVVRNMYTNLSNNVYRDIDMVRIQRQMSRAEEMEDVDEVFVRLDYLLQEVMSMPEGTYLQKALATWEGMNEETRERRQQFIVSNEHRRGDVVKALREALEKRLGSSSRETRRVRFEVLGFGECLAENMVRSLRLLTEEIPRVAAIEDGGHIAQDLEALEERIIEAQALSRKDSRFDQRVGQLLESSDITAELAQVLQNDLTDNYTNLELMMNKASGAIKRAREQQIRFGLKRDVRYLDMTLNLPDLEELKSEYGFLETLSLEDLKRYCLAYRMTMDMMSDLLRKLEDDHPDVYPEIKKQYTRRVRKNVIQSHLGKKQGGKEMTAVLKVAILRHDTNLFEAEAQRLIYFLNYADPKLLKSRDTYKNYMHLFRLAEDGDVKVNRWLKHIISKLNAMLFRYQPEGYVANFENNRQAFISDLENARGDLEWY